MSGTLSNLKGLLGEQRNPKEPKGTLKKYEKPYKTLRNPKNQKES